MFTRPQAGKMSAYVFSFITITEFESQHSFFDPEL